MIKVATAFSGGLAACEFGLKYEEIEHEVVFACEFDKYARKQYLEFHGYPISNFYEDICDLDAKPYKDKIDLFVFGSPCQDLSLAGKRKGFNGEKSSLFRQGARVIEEMMPKVFIFENVKGLLSSNCGADYKEVVKTFQYLGYLIASKVLNAKEHGTAQNRERVFIVGFLNEDEYHAFNFEDTQKLTNTLKDYIDYNVDEKYYLSDKMIECFQKTGEISKGYEFKHQSGDKHINAFTCKYANYSTDTYIKVVGNLNIKGNESINRIYGDDGLSPALTTMEGGNRQPKVLVKSATKKGYEVATEDDSINLTHPDSKTRRGRVGKGVAQTLDCSCNQGVLEDFRIRKLTPKECFRLQGVKDEDINLVNSDTQSYKIAGNAIEVNTMRSILRSLYKNGKRKDTLF